MKRIFTLVFIVVAFTTSLSSQSTSIIENVLRQSVEQKILTMQELIQFDDAKAIQLVHLEFAYLLDVQKVENCLFCNKKKRINTLQKNRDEKLQEILDRDQYIKYISIENNLINKENILWLGTDEH